MTKSSLKEKWMCKLSKKRKLTTILRVFENCSSWPFSVIECKPWNTYLSPRTKVPTYLTIFDSIMVQKLRQMNMSATASYPEVPLSRWKFAPKGRRERENCQDVASPLFFHLPMVPWASLPVTRVSRSPLCKKTKGLRRRQCVRHDSGKLPTYPIPVILFFTLYSRTAWSKYRQGESWTTWPSWITWTNWIAWTIRPQRHTIKYPILKIK